MTDPYHSHAKNLDRLLTFGSPSEVSPPTLGHLIDETILPDLPQLTLGEVGPDLTTKPRESASPLEPLSASAAQERLFEHFLTRVRRYPPAVLLKEFEDLFIHGVDRQHTTALQAVYQLVLLNDPGLFQQTLKRICYILINNWSIQRQEAYIAQLLSLLDLPSSRQASPSLVLSRLHQWLADFVASQAYWQLSLFVVRPDGPTTISQGIQELSEKKPPDSDPPIADRTPDPAKPSPEPAPSTAEVDRLDRPGRSTSRRWADRYAAHHLASEAAEHSNSLEQRQAAAARVKQLRDRFKFDLALYMAKLQSSPSQHPSDRDTLKNPTNLGPRVLQIVKAIVLRNGRNSYLSLAHLFLEQTRGLTYRGYKQSLLKYLFFGTTQRELTDGVRQKIKDRLDQFSAQSDPEPRSDDLHEITCRHLINLLLTEDNQQPSHFFLLLLAWGNPLAITLLLLKLILICPSARSHLDRCVATLLSYYQQFDEKDCRWVIPFFDILNVTFAIYTENVHYNLVDLGEPWPDPRDRSDRPDQPIEPDANLDPAGDRKTKIDREPAPTRPRSVVSQEEARGPRSANQQGLGQRESAPARRARLDRYRIFSQTSSHLSPDEPAPADRDPDPTPGRSPEPTDLKPTAPDSPFDQALRDTLDLVLPETPGPNQPPSESQ